MKIRRQTEKGSTGKTKHCRVIERQPKLSVNKQLHNIKVVSGSLQPLWYLAHINEKGCYNQREHTVERLVLHSMTVAIEKKEDK